MSQTITYKTKYKTLDNLKRGLDHLVKSGVFGKNPQVDFVAPNDTEDVKRRKKGLFNPGPDVDVVFVVRAPGSGMFGDGFYEKGFAIGRNKKTGEISIVYDFRYGSDNEKVTAETRKKLEAMIESADTLEKAKKTLGKSITSIQEKSPTEWVIEGEFTEEDLREIMKRLPKQ